MAGYYYPKENPHHIKASYFIESISNRGTATVITKTFGRFDNCQIIEADGDVGEHVLVEHEKDGWLKIFK